MEDDETSSAQPAAAEPGRIKRRFITGLIGLAAAVVSWFIGAAVLPRWWAQRLGDIIDGRLTLGSLLGITFGAVFTTSALFVLSMGLRFRRGWRRGLATVAIAALVAAPNLLTLGIVVGNGNAAHAGERILDVDGPGFRGGTLVGTIIGVLVAFAFGFMSNSRARNKRKAKRLKAELDAQ